jgi:hypothetical protein
MTAESLQRAKEALEDAGYVVTLPETTILCGICALPLAKCQCEIWHGLAGELPGERGKP